MKDPNKFTDVVRWVTAKEFLSRADPAHFRCDACGTDDEELGAVGFGIPFTTVNDGEGKPYIEETSTPIKRTLCVNCAKLLSLATWAAGPTSILRTRERLKELEENVATLQKNSHPPVAIPIQQFKDRLELLEAFRRNHDSMYTKLATRVDALEEKGVDTRSLEDFVAVPGSTFEAVMCKRCNQFPNKITRGDSHRALQCHCTNIETKGRTWFAMTLAWNYLLEGNPLAASAQPVMRTGVYYAPQASVNDDTSNQSSEASETLQPKEEYFCVAFCLGCKRFSEDYMRIDCEDCGDARVIFAEKYIEGASRRETEAAVWRVIGSMNDPVMLEEQREHFAKIRTMVKQKTGGVNEDS